MFAAITQAFLKNLLKIKANSSGFGFAIQELLWRSYLNNRSYHSSLLFCIHKNLVKNLKFWNFIWNYKLIVWIKILKMQQCKLIVFSNFYCIFSCCLNLFSRQIWFFVCIYYSSCIYICILLYIHVTTVLYCSLFSEHKY